MVSTQIGYLHCPFRGLHCCFDGKDGSKSISRLVSHLKMLHLCNDKRKSVIRSSIGDDWNLFMALEDSLRVVEQWLCGRCMSIHAMSQACHHPDGLIRVTHET